MQPLISLAEEDEGCNGPKWVSCCVYDRALKIMQHMHGSIPYMFDHWANLFVHSKELHDRILKSKVAQKYSKKVTF